MANVWEHVQQLKDATLYTNAQHKPFDIVDVLSDRIIFVPQDGQGTQRWASREQIETMVQVSRSSGAILPKQVQEQYPNDYNGSSIAAIVNIVRSK